MKKMISVILSLSLVLCAISASAKVEPTPTSASAFDENNTRALTGYLTIIMQGDTDSASDCVAFENALEVSGNGYTGFSRKGWTENTNTPNYIRATASDFLSSKGAHVAYYSGHGASGTYPVLNAVSGSGMTSSAFNVATTLGVSGSNWASSSLISSSDNLRVMVLASCLQLDSSVVKYYARIMKASGVRVIAGYHDIAPSLGDDTIATNFVQNADAGYCVLEAWRMANTYQNWAVLVFWDNENQAYNMPGFPGTEYPAPSSGASVYRYANFLSTPREESTASVGDSIDAQISALPLSITMTTIQNEASLQDYSRDVAWANTSVPDDDSDIQRMLATALNENMEAKIPVQYQVAREELDTETGIVADTEVIVERTYQYFDTHLGVKIADSYVSATVDSEGVNTIKVNRKSVAATNTNITQTTATGETGQTISQSAALKLLLQDHPCIAESELYDVSLAYVPDGNGCHVLCYEFMFSHGFSYVNVVTGDILSIG